MENKPELLNVDIQEILKCTTTQLVQDCQSLTELEKIFDMICPIVGSHKEYTSEKLKYKIEQLRLFVNSGNDFDKVPWNLITRTHGIRAKCMELFMYEKLGI